jgi:dipeptidyl aminopeptidase/acylaminoacyl peptidase
MSDKPSVFPYLHCASVSGPRFDEDGAAISFLSNLSGNWEAFRVSVPAAGGAPLWPDRLTFTGDRVGDVRPVPGRPGAYIVAADQGGDERWRLLEIAPSGVRDLDPGAGIMRHLAEPSPTGGLFAFSSNRRLENLFDVYVGRLAGGEPQAVFVRDALLYPISFGPDGTTLLVRETRPTKDQALWLVPLGAAGAPGGEPRLLIEGPREMTSQFDTPAWSPDGRTIYASTNAGREFYALVAIDVASGDVRELYAPQADVDSLALSPDGGTIALLENHHGSAVLRLVPSAGGAPTTLLDQGGVLEGLDWAPDGSRLAFVWDRPEAGRDVYVQGLADPTPLAATRAPLGGLDRATLVAEELLTFTARDGLPLEAFLMRPRDAAPPYAAVWIVHGGPEGQSRESFDAIAQFFAASGLAVVKPNVRGSTGYGRAFEHADDVERRLDSVDDLRDMVEALTGRGLLDPARQAVMGGSYGGFMTLSTLTRHPDLWCAGVDIVGIASFVTMLQRTSAWRRPVREAEYGSLEHHRALLEELSPIRHADRIRAPLIVIHGRHDPRVPVEEAEQIVANLKGRNHPVEFLCYEDEGHGLTKIRNRIEAYGRIADFLLEQAR